MTKSCREIAEEIVNKAEVSRFDETAYFTVMGLIDEIEKALSAQRQEGFEEAVIKSSEIVKKQSLYLAMKILSLLPKGEGK